MTGTDKFPNGLTNKETQHTGLGETGTRVGERTDQQWLLRGTARRGVCDHMAEGRAFGLWIWSNTGQAAIHTDVPLRPDG